MYSNITACLLPTTTTHRHSLLSNIWRTGVSGPRWFSSIPNPFHENVQWTPNCTRYLMFSWWRLLCLPMLRIRLDRTWYSYYSHSFCFLALYISLLLVYAVCLLSHAPLCPHDVCSDCMFLSSTSISWSSRNVAWCKVSNWNAFGTISRWFSTPHSWSFIPSAGAHRAPRGLTGLCSLWPAARRISNDRPRIPMMGWGYMNNGPIFSDTKKNDHLSGIELYFSMPYLPHFLHVEMLRALTPIHLALTNTCQTFQTSPRNKLLGLGIIETV